MSEIIQGGSEKPPNHGHHHNHRDCSHSDQGGDASKEHDLCGQDHGGPDCDGNHGLSDNFGRTIVWANAGAGLWETIAGWRHGSSAVLADGIHNAGDALAYWIQTAARKAQLNNDPKTVAKLRTLGAWAMSIAGGITFAKSGVNLVESISQENQEEVPSLLLLASTIGSLAVSLGPFSYFAYKNKEKIKKWTSLRKILNQEGMQSTDKDLFRHLIFDLTSSSSAFVSALMLSVSQNEIIKPLDATIGAIASVATMRAFRPTKANLKEDHVPIGELSKDIALGGLSKLTNLRNKFKRKKTNLPNTNVQSFFRFITPEGKIIDLPANLMNDPTFAQGFNGQDFVFGSKNYDKACQQAILDLEGRGMLAECTVSSKNPEQKNTDIIQEDVAKKGLFSFIKSKFKKHKTTESTKSNKAVSNKFNATSLIGQAQTVYAGLGAKYTQFTADIGNKIAQNKKWLAPLGVAAVGLTAYKFAPEIIDSFNPDNLLTVDIADAADQTNPNPLISTTPSTNDIPANESPAPPTDTSPTPPPNDADADQPIPPEENNLNILSTEQQLALAGSPQDTTTEPWARFKEYFGTDQLANIKMANAFELAQNNGEPIQKVYIGDGLNPDLFMYKLTDPSAEDPYDPYEITRILAKYTEST